MPTDSKHSPTPWDHDASGALLYTDEEEGTLELLPQTVANAAHAVRCVNAHDELIAALKEVRAAITAVNRGAGHTVFNPAATQLVDAALAKAKS